MSARPTKWQHPSVDEYERIAEAAIEKAQGEKANGTGLRDMVQILLYQLSLHFHESLLHAQLGNLVSIDDAVLNHSASALVIAGAPLHPNLDVRSAPQGAGNQTEKKETLQ